jgi:hypothetical protein
LLGGRAVACDNLVGQDENARRMGIAERPGDHTIHVTADTHPPAVAYDVGPGINRIKNRLGDPGVDSPQIVLKRPILHEYLMQANPEIVVIIACDTRIIVDLGIGHTQNSHAMPAIRRVNVKRGVELTSA